MIDKKLGPDGDIDISSGGAELVRGLDASVQNLRIAFQSFEGDWFLDLRDGLPYVGRIFVKNANKGDIESLYRAQAKKQPDVVSVDSLSADFSDVGTFRKMSIAAKVTFVQSPLSTPVNATLSGLP